jgi:hypothetical protein
VVVAMPGRSRAVVRFTVADGRVAAIDLITDPARLEGGSRERRDEAREPGAPRLVRGTAHAQYTHSQVADNATSAHGLHSMCVSA